MCHLFHFHIQSTQTSNSFLQLPIQHPAPVTPKHGTQQTRRVLFQTYSRDLRVVPEKLPLLRQLVFPSHIVTEHLVFCIQCDSHHWFVEEWHQVSSSRIADSV